MQAERRKLEMEFNRVINQIEKQYQDKMRKVEKEWQVKDFKE